MNDTHRRTTDKPLTRTFYYYREDEAYGKQHMLITSRDDDTIETLVDSLRNQYGTKVRVKLK